MENNIFMILRKYYIINLEEMEYSLERALHLLNFFYTTNFSVSASHIDPRVFKSCDMNRCAIFESFHHLQLLSITFQKVFFFVLIFFHIFSKGFFFCFNFFPHFLTFLKLKYSLSHHHLQLLSITFQKVFFFNFFLFLFNFLLF